MLKKIGTTLALPTILIIVSLWFEYHSGFFIPKNTNAQGASFNETLWFTASLLTFLIFLARSQFLWFKPKEHVREDYSVLTVCVVVVATILVGIAVQTEIMPWYLTAAYVQLVKGPATVIPSPRFSDYMLLILGYIAVFTTFRSQHRHWSGRKSVQQYQREQKERPVNFIIEGIGELVRIVKKQGGDLERYDDAWPNQFTSQLDGNTEVVPWKDEARELVRLSSSIYSIDPEDGWHDVPGCWEGCNVKTGDLVFVFPILAAPSSEQMIDFTQYAKRIATMRKRNIVELVVALSDGTPIQLDRKTRVRVVTKASLLDALVDFRDYENEIRKRVDASYLPDSAVTIHDVFVPSRFSGNDLSKSILNVEDTLMLWLAEPGYRQIALLGEYGQGKSTTSLMMTYHLLTNSNSLGRIPILIELRGMSPRNLTPLQLLGAWASRYRIEPQALMRLLIAGRLLLIFEGFDEMALVGDAEMRLQHFKTLWQFCYPAAKIIITGRPNFFLDEEEMKAALGISKPRSNQPYCESIRLLPFGIDEIRQALRAHNPAVRDQICDLAETDPRFLELVSRPSLLHIVSVLWEKDQLSTKVEQLNSAFVMDLFVRHSYRRQGRKEIGSAEFMALTTVEREYFMRGIAASMVAQRLPNQMNAGKLNIAIESLIEVIPDAVTTQNATISGETRSPLRLRLIEGEYALEHVQTDVRACGLLVDDPASPGTFRFGHKSFMEYLAASVLAEVIREESSPVGRSIIRATNLTVADVFELPVSVDFLAEMLRAPVKSKSGSPLHLNEGQLVRRLFILVCGGTKLRRLGLRIRLFELSFQASLRNFHPALRLLLAVGAPSGIIFIGGAVAAALFLILPVLHSPVNSASPLGKIGTIISSPTTTMVVVMLAAIQIWITMARVLDRGNSAFLLNWMSQKLGIADSVLHRFAGTSFLPWARSQPFAYFLPPGAASDRSTEMPIASKSDSIAPREED